MAKARGVSFKTVQRIWNLHGLKPHQSRTFKLSRDKHFVEKGSTSKFGDRSGVK